jgi:hypothetical protein
VTGPQRVRLRLIRNFVEVGAAVRERMMTDVNRHQSDRACKNRVRQNDSPAPHRR